MSKPPEPLREREWALRNALSKIMAWIRTYPQKATIVKSVLDEADAALNASDAALALPPLTPEVIVGIRRGQAEVRAGNTIPWEKVKSGRLAALKARLEESEWWFDRIQQENMHPTDLTDCTARLEQLRVALAAPSKSKDAGLRESRLRERIEKLRDRLPNKSSAGCAYDTCGTCMRKRLDEALAETREE